MGMYAHVAYVTPPTSEPDAIGFLFAALREPGNLLGVLAGGLLILALLGAWFLRPLGLDAWDRFVARAWSYRSLVPWMLRLSFGLLLIGAGLSSTAFAPDVRIAGFPEAILTLLGFLLLIGLAVRMAALAGLLVFLAALALRLELVGIVEIAGGLAALAFVGAGLPSLDDLLRAAFPSVAGSRLMTAAPSGHRYADAVPLLVRLGLGGSFLASGIADKLLIYNQALDTVAKYHLTGVIPVDPNLWVLGASATESFLGAALLLGMATRPVAMLAFVVLTLTLFGLPDDPVVAHVGLFGMCSILVVLGGGRWSVDAWRAARLHRPMPRPDAPAVSPLSA